MDDWKKQIGIAYLVKQRVAELDVEGLWPFHMPEVAASEESLVELEQSLGFSLDPLFRRFLCYANGWRGLFQSNCVFGVSDYDGSSEFKRATELLNTLEPLQEVCGISREDCFPIGVSTDGSDVFVIEKQAVSKDGGRVFWLAGQLVDAFTNFDEFFLAMVDYNREEATALSRE